MIDLNDVRTAAIVFIACACMLVISIVMDARRLPLGRVKWMPWTILTLAFVLFTILAGRQVVIDYIRS